METDSLIVQIPEFLGGAACRRLVEIFDRHEPEATCGDYQGNPVIHCFDDFVDADSRREILAAAAACRDHIRQRFGEEFGPLYPETIAIAMLPPGGFHPFHADNSHRDDAGRWVPNHTPGRVVSTLMYLNGDFDGGEIVFEQQDLRIKPDQGLLVAFPSSADYPHEVLEVTRGRRYSVAMWFINDAQQSLIDEPA